MELLDHVNPVLMRHLRQAVRGKEFNIIFFGLLLFGLIVSVFALQAADTAMQISSIIGIALIVLFAFIIPLLTAHYTVTEQSNKSYELVKITALSAGKIVMGAYWAGLLTGVVAMSALTPFLATSFFFGGVSIYVVLLWMGAPILAGGLLNAIALGLTAGVEKKLTQRLGQLLIVGAGIFGLIGGIGVMQVVSRYGMPWFAFRTMLVVAGPLYPTVLVTSLLIARSRFLPPQSNRVGAVRCSALVTLVAFLGGLQLAIHYASPDYERVGYAEVGFIAGCITASVFAFFAVTEDFVAPRRVVRRMATSRFWEAGAVFFRPGAARGITWSLLCLALVFVFGIVNKPHWMFHERWREQYSLTLAGGVVMLAYLTVLTGVPVLILQAVKHRVTPFQRRFTVICTLAGCLTVSTIFFAIHPIAGPRSWAWILNPFVTLAFLFDTGGRGLFHWIRDVPSALPLLVPGAASWIVLAAWAAKTERAALKAVKEAMHGRRT